MALDDLEEILVDQGKIRPHNAKYGPEKEGGYSNRKHPYCKWLDTTPTYRIRKAFAGLKLHDGTVPDDPTNLEKA